MIQKKFLYILLFLGFHNIVICSAGLSDDHVRVVTISQGKIQFTGGGFQEACIHFVKPQSSQPKRVMLEITQVVHLPEQDITLSVKNDVFSKPLSIVHESNLDARVAFELLKNGILLKNVPINNVTLVDPKYHGLEGFNDRLRSYGLSLPWTPTRRTQDCNEGDKTRLTEHINVPIVITDSSFQQDEKYSYPALKIARDLNAIGFKNVKLEKKKQSNTCNQDSTFQPEMSFLNDALQKDEEIFTAKKARNGMFIIPALFVAASVMMGGK